MTVAPSLIAINVSFSARLSCRCLRMTNWNYLRFATTEVLEVARNQADIDEEIGHDVSIVATYRPFMTQNIVIRASYARLFPGQGFKDLFPDEDSDYFLLNLLFQY